MTEKRKIDQFADVLFEHGIETYDPMAPEGKKSANIGGAKLFWLLGWQNNTGSIEFHNKDFFEAIRQFPGTLYSVNRVKLDANKHPILVKNSDTNVQRINNCLILYSTFDEDPNVGRNMRDRLLEDLKERKFPMDLSNYIEVCNRINSDNIRALETFTYTDLNGIESNLKLHAAVLIQVPSGPPNSGAFWGTKPKASVSRTQMSRSVSYEGNSDLPF
jgi:hypothetical protein